VAAGGALGGAAVAAPAAVGAGKDGATKPKSLKRAAPQADEKARPSIPTEKPPLSSCRRPTVACASPPKTLQLSCR
jgi:hypothetical protein